jgi:uncharacterized phage-like protein YoqJ
MLQVNFFQNKMIKSAAFTGHRELGEDFKEIFLIKTIKECVKMGVCVFYCGMAKGFDLLAAELVLKEKQFSPVKLIACVPYPTQAAAFGDEDRKRYETVLSQADETVVLCDKYSPQCFQKRNEYMADRADILISYCRKKQSGTGRTVAYFKKNKPDNPVFEL